MDLKKLKMHIMLKLLEIILVKLKDLKKFKLTKEKKILVYQKI